MFPPSGSRVLVPALLLLASLAGCNKQDIASAREHDPNRLAITGEVLLHGKPLSRAVIAFDSEQKGIVGSGATITDGRFAIEAVDGLVPGVYKVTLYELVDDHGGTAEGGRPPRIVIPPEYGPQSKQKIEVKAGQSNHFRLDLK